MKRGLRAIETTRDLGYDRRSKDIELWTDIGTGPAIAQAAGLPIARRQKELVIPLQSAFSIWVHERDASGAEGDGNSHPAFYDLMSLCQNHARLLQQEYGLGWHMDKAFAAVGKKPSYFAGASDSDRNKFFVFYAPYVITGRGGLATAGNWPKKLPGLFVWSSLAQYGLHEFFTRTGPIKLLPPSYINAQYMVDHAKLAFSKTMESYLKIPVRL